MARFIKFEAQNLFFWTTRLGGKIWNGYQILSTLIYYRELDIICTLGVLKHLLHSVTMCGHFLSLASEIIALFDILCFIDNIENSRSR